MKYRKEKNGIGIQDPNLELRDIALNEIKERNERLDSKDISDLTDIHSIWFSYANTNSLFESYSKLNYSASWILLINIDSTFIYINWFSECILSMINSNS